MRASKTLRRVPRLEARVLFDRKKPREYLLTAMASSELETIFSIARFRVTNTLLATLVVDAVIVALVFAIRRRLSLVPGKLQGIAEGVVDYLHTTTEQV